MSIDSEVARLQGAKTALISKMTDAWYEASARNSLQELVAMLDLGQGVTTPAVYPSGTLNDQIDRLSDVRDKLAEKMTASGDYTLTGNELLSELVELLNVPKRVNPAYCVTFYGISDFKLKTSSGGKGWDGTLLYRRPGMDDWAEWDGSEIYTSQGRLWLQGVGNTKIGGASSIFTITDYGTAPRLYVDGNMETLLDWQTVANGGHPTMAAYCFNQLFRNCTTLVRAPYLGSTALSDHCYSVMYYGCTALTQVPDFPAWTSVSGSYNCREMFHGCSALQNAPALPAVKLAPYIYQNMFWNCTGLVKAPDLLAPVLEQYCYTNMFYGCSALVTAPALAFTSFRDGSTSYHSCESMFQNCTSLLYPPLLYADKLTSDCYMHMFWGCTNLKFSETESTTYPYPYPLGKTYYSGAQNPLLQMFYGTGGTLTNPTIDMVGKTVYCATEPVAA